MIAGQRTQKYFIGHSNSWYNNMALWRGSAIPQSHPSSGHFCWLPTTLGAAQSMRKEIVIHRNRMAILLVADRQRRSLRTICAELNAITDLGRNCVCTIRFMIASRTMIWNLIRLNQSKGPLRVDVEYVGHFSY